MADVKCGRCDRYYSKFRSRCPYCGALRSNKGKRASSGDNATWKVVVGVGILAILIAAVIAVLYTTYAPKNESGSGEEGQVDPADSGGVISATDDGSTVKSVVITCDNEDKTEITLEVGETVKLSYRTDPAGSAAEPVWACSDWNVASISQAGDVTAVAAGTATVYVSVGDKTAECAVKVNGR